MHDKATPLHFATLSGSYEGCKLLLGHGASANDKDGKGCTPYYYAVLNKNIKLIKLFEEFDGDARIENEVHLIIRQI